MSPRDTTIEFFGPGEYMFRVGGGFDMDERDAAIEGDDRGGHDRRGVALGDEAIGFCLFEDGVESLQTACGQACECLIGAHQLEVVIGVDAEVVGDLREHFLVLSCRAGRSVQSGASSGGSVKNRSDLDGFGRVPKVNNARRRLIQKSFSVLMFSTFGRSEE